MNSEPNRFDPRAASEDAGAGGWSHRVVKRVIENADGSNKVLYGIHEVYWHRHKKPELEQCGHVFYMTSRPVPISAESVESLRWMLNETITCLDMQVIDYELHAAGLTNESHE